MRKTWLFTLALAIGVLVLCGGTLKAQETAKVDGAWTLSMQSPRGGTFNQTLKIQQDGEKIKGTISGRRGETPFEGTVKGNAISFTVKRDTPNGTFTSEYTGTVDGDSIKGKIHNDRFDADFTAKRGEAPAQKEQQ